MPAKKKAAAATAAAAGGDDDGEKVAVTWYYKKDLRKTKDNKKGWAPYTKADSTAIEDGYAAKEKTIVLNKTWKIDFKSNIQYRISDKERWRPIKRVEDRNKSSEIEDELDGDGGSDSDGGDDKKATKKKPAAAAAAAKKGKKAAAAAAADDDDAGGDDGSSPAPAPAAAAPIAKIKKSDSAAGAAGEIAGLKAEIAQLKADWAAEKADSQKTFESDLAGVKSQLADVEREAAREASATKTAHDAAIAALESTNATLSSTVASQKKQLTAHAAENKAALSQMEVLNDEMAAAAASHKAEVAALTKAHDAATNQLTKEHDQQLNQLKIDQHNVLHKLTGLHNSEIKVRDETIALQTTRIAALEADLAQARARASQLLERQKVIASSLSVLQAQATDGDLARANSNGAAARAALAAAATVPPSPAPAPVSGPGLFTRAVSSLFGTSAAPATPARASSASGAATAAAIGSLIEQTQLTTDLKELPPAASASIPDAKPVPASRLESTLKRATSEAKRSVKRKASNGGDDDADADSSSKARRFDTNATQADGALPAAAAAETLPAVDEKHADSEASAQTEAQTQRLGAAGLDSTQEMVTPVRASSRTRSRSSAAADLKRADSKTSGFEGVLLKELISCPDANSSPSAVPMTCVSLGGVLAVGFMDGSIGLYNTSTWTCAKVIPAPPVASKKAGTPQHVTALLPISKNRLVVAAGPYIRIYSYEEASTDPDQEIDVGAGHRVSCLYLLADGRIAAGVQGTKHGVRLYNGNDFTAEGELPTRSSEVRVLSQTKDGRVVVGCTSSELKGDASLEHASVEIWTLGSSGSVGRRRTGGAAAAAVSSGGSKPVRSLLTHDIKIDAEEGLRVSGLVVLEDGRLVVGYEYCKTGSRALNIYKLEDKSGGETVSVLEAVHTPTESEAVFTQLATKVGGASASLVFASTWQGKLIAYDVNTLKRVKTVDAHPETFYDENSHVVGLQGGAVATLGGFGQLKIWK